MIKQIIMLFIGLLIFLQLFGCLISQIAPANKASESWVGHNISERDTIMNRSGSYASRINWTRSTYSLDNGNWVLIEPVRKDCLIHWEVDPSGIIVGFKLVGARCY